MLDADKLRSEFWEVRPTTFATALGLVEAHHYSKGGSNTGVFFHGLFARGYDQCCGVAWWLPPTRVAAESVDRERWTRVLALTRLVVVPGVPKNAGSFLLSRSVKAIRATGRFVALVTYADESQGHTGNVYRASGWEYVGKTGPYTRWVSSDGRQVSTQATRTRTKSEMLNLGHKVQGAFFKHKYVKRLKSVPTRGVAE